MSVEIGPFNAFFLDKVQLRFLGPSDIDVLKVLCREWFPIEYVIVILKVMYDTLLFS